MRPRLDERFGVDGLSARGAAGSASSAPMFRIDRNGKSYCAKGGGGSVGRCGFRFFAFALHDDVATFHGHVNIATGFKM